MKLDFDVKPHAITAAAAATALTFTPSGHVEEPPPTILSSSCARVSTIEETRFESALSVGQEPDYAATLPEEEWKPSMDRRFRALLEREILGHISNQERGELQRLREDRERLVLALTPEEMGKELRRRKALRDLMRSLDNYLAVVDASAY